jgi:RimJ/RimL family protein N-acetyltransferase
MTNAPATKRTYPWTKQLGGTPVTLRLMAASDAPAVLAFAQSLPADDLLFLSVDITRTEAVEAWARQAADGRVTTVLAEADGRLVGHGTLRHEDLVWTRHLGGIELLVSPTWRGKGLGHLLANEVFLLAQEKNLQKVVARMASEQRGAIQVFERLGFRAEALLADYVMDRQGRTHDLIVMSYDVTGLTE